MYANERGLHERVEELAPKRQVVADHFPSGDPLDCGGLLNDLTAAANGGLYYTGGPYYVDPKGVVTKEGGDDAPGGNGIILSPDEKTLYITGRMRNAPPAPMGYGGGLVAFDVQPDGHLANARQFAQTCGDGSTIDAEGRIYCTGGRIPDPKDPTKSLVGVGVIDPKDGHVLGIIPAPGGSAISVAFGGKDRKTLFLLHSGGREADGTTHIRVTPANPRGEAVEKAATAGAFQIGLAATLGGVRRIPGGAIADSIGMADLRGTRGAARPVVARVVGAIGVGAGVPFRSGKNFVLNRRRIADAVNHLPTLVARGLLEEIVAALRLDERIAVKVGEGH